MTVNSWSRSATHWFEAVNHKLESQSAVGNIPNSTSPFSTRGSQTYAGTGTLRYSASSSASTANCPMN
jgi:hypothetical protein